MEQELFIYDWNHKDELVSDGVESCQIYIFALNRNNESVCIRIEDFAPYIYLEIDNDNFDWSLNNNQVSWKNKFFDLNYSLRKNIVKVEFLQKKKLFYVHEKRYWFVKVYFHNITFIKKQLPWILKQNTLLVNKKVCHMKIHEDNASPILQLTVNQNIPTSGWISIPSLNNIKEKDKISICKYEYIVPFKKVKKINNNNVSNPALLSFDIEVYSSKVNLFPNAKREKDKIFQISAHHFQKNKHSQKYLLSLGNPDKKVVGQDVITKTYSSEAELLLGFKQLIIDLEINLLTGYNIFTFDIPYILERTEHNSINIAKTYSAQSFMKDKPSEIKKIEWSSSAYKNQQFKFLLTEGRLWIDLLPIIKREYKLNNYKLDTVAKHFIGQEKDDLDAKGIFECYEKGMNGDDKAMGIVGKYCVKDSELCTVLFNKLLIWPYLTEMAKICNVPMLDLYTRGQQIKVFSQVYQMCNYNDFIVEKDGYKAIGDEKFEGAMVFPPKAGAYDYVVPFDFTSLYPTTMIAYNICYSTLVIDDSVPDAKCHVIEWETCTGCIHDTTIRKGKIPKDKIICTKGNPYKYRFLKEPKGILPSLLENLLAARTKTKSEMKSYKKKLSELKKDGSLKEIENCESIIDVLDKRQLAYKVSANSVYGSMGASKGFLPFLPGAMCTTAMGRKNIQKAADYLQRQFGGTLIYGD